MIETPAIYCSFVQRLDPRIKIVTVLIFSIIVAVSEKFSALVSAFTLSFIIITAANIPLLVIIKRLIPLNLFVIFLWLFLPFTFEGNAIFTICGWPVTQEGIQIATMISIKSNVIMLLLIALTLSTPIVSIAHAMHELKVPKKVVYLFFFTLRYIHVIHNEYTRLLNSMKIRSFKPKTDIHTYRTYAYMVGMILIRSMDRAQRVHNAMKCRGFNGNLYSLNNFSLQKTDTITLAVMIFMLSLLGIMEWTTITLF